MYKYKQNSCTSKESEEKKTSRLRCDSKGLILETVSGSSGDDLAGAHVELAGAISERRAIVVDMAKQRGTAVTLDLGPLALDSPVIEALEERPDLVFWLESELGGVHRGEGGAAFVAGLEVEIGGKQMRRVQIQIRSAFRTAVDGSHYMSILLFSQTGTLQQYQYHSIILSFFSCM